MSIFQIFVFYYIRRTPNRSLFILLFFLIQYTHLNQAFFTTHFNLVEETAKGTSLGSLATKLPRQFQNELQQIRFRLINSEHASYFEIGSTSGIIKVKERIDRESLCPSSPSTEVGHTIPGHLVNGQCQLSFSVNILRFTKTGVDIAEVVRVIVDVQDLDDNLCEFLPSNHQTLYVTENNAIGPESRIALHRLVDLDIGDHNGIDYRSIRLQGPKHLKSSFENLFGLEISNTTSKMAPYALYLILNQPLDYETEQSYHILLWAGGYRNDSTEICFLNITLNVLDENDNQPKFLEKSVHIHVMENATLSEPIYTAQAQDLDKSSLHSKLIFELSSLNNQVIRSTFMVSPLNGSIFLRQPLRHSQISMYQLSLIVRNPSPNEHAQTKWIVQTNEPLNSDEPYSVRFYDTMTLFVHVSDINDNSPSISVYTPNGSEVLTLQEEISSMTPVDFALVSVTDEDTGKNGQITCQLGSNYTNLFKLSLIGYESGQENSEPIELPDDEPNTALYKLSAIQPLDREESDTIPILIICRDHGLQALETNYTAILNLIDINDNNPQFDKSHIYVQVTEDSDPMRQANKYFITQLNATDDDLGNNAKLVYHLVDDGAISNLVRLDPHTGVMHSLGKLDREENSSLSVVVKVSDQGDPPRSSSAIVHVTILDYNDEFPRFEHAFYEFEIVENAVLGEFVGLINVKDPDQGLNGALNFRLEPRYNDKKYPLAQDGIPFKIVSRYLKEEDFYEVRLFAHGDIDREVLIRDRFSNQGSTDAGEPMIVVGRNRTNPHYEFLIRAEDGGTPKRVSTVTVFVDILDLNDNAPRFIKPEQDDSSFRISHLTRRGDTLLQVKAIDHDADENGTIKYSILDAIPLENCLNQEVGTPSSTKSARTQQLVPVGNEHNSICQMFSYLAIDSKTGLLILHESLSPDMIGLTCRLIIEAKDSGFIPLRSQLAVCFQITDDLYPDPISNQTLTDQWTSFQYKRYGTFYLYIFTIIISMGLVVSLLFLCTSCWIWRRSKLKSRKSVIQGLPSGKATDFVISPTTTSSHMTTGTESITYQNLYTPIPNYIASESSNEQTIIQATPHHNWTNLSYAEPLYPTQQHQQQHYHTLPPNKRGFGYTNDPFLMQSDMNDYHSNLQPESQNFYSDHKSSFLSQPVNACSEHKDRHSIGLAAMQIS